MEKRSVAFNTAAQLSGKAATLLFGLATTALIYRTLGNTQYGVYVFVTSFVLFFATVSDWGTEIITLREVSKTSTNQEYIIVSSMLLRLLLSLITVILADISIHLLPQWHLFVMPVTLFSFVLVALSLKISAQPLFLARGQAIFGAIGEAVNNGLYFIAVLIFLPKNPSLFVALSLLIAATLIASLVCWAFVARLITLRIHFNKNFAKILVKEALPTGALLALFYVYNRLDVVLLQILKGNDIVGHYGLAYKIHDNLVQGAAFLMNAVFPLIAANPSSPRLHVLYHRAFHILFLAAFFLIFLVLLGGPYIINLIGGNAATPAIPLLQILVFATFVAFLNHLTGYTLIALGHQRTSLLIAVFALTLNIIGNIIFIPIFSAKAAAIMTIITEGSVFCLSSLALYRYARLTPSLLGVFQTFSTALKSRGLVFEK